MIAHFKYGFFCGIVAAALALTFSCYAQVLSVNKIKQPPASTNDGLRATPPINERIRLATYIGVVDVRSGYADIGNACYRVSSLEILKGTLTSDQACSEIPMAIGRKYLIIAYDQRRHLTVEYQMLVVSQAQFPVIAPLKEAVVVGPPSSSRPYLLLRDLPGSYDIRINNKHSRELPRPDATVHLFSYYSMTEVRRFIEDVLQACDKRGAGLESDPCLQVMRKWSYFNNIDAVPPRAKKGAVTKKPW